MPRRKNDKRSAGAIDADRQPSQGRLVSKVLTTIGSIFGQEAMPPDANILTPDATVHCAPISSGGHFDVPFGRNLAVTWDTDKFTALVSITIIGLPSVHTLYAPGGPVYSGQYVTVPSAQISSLMLSKRSAGNPVSGALEIYATMSAVNGILSDTKHVFLPLTLDLDSRRSVRWQTGTSGNWADANWGLDTKVIACPLPTQDVMIDAPGAVITCSSSVSINSLVVGRNATLIITGNETVFALTTADRTPLKNAGTILIEGGATLDVGNTAFPGIAMNTGTLEVKDGALNVNNVEMKQGGVSRIVGNITKIDK